MLRKSRSFFGAVLLAALVAPSLGGCAVEGPPGAARAQAGVAGEIVERLKEEDDEAEAREYAELREAAQERRELEAEREVEWR